MAIERFIWTHHAEGKHLRRLLDHSELERAIRDGHSDRRRMGIPPAPAEWRIDGLLADGRRFVVVYDHPHGADHTAVRIISVWDY
jgi:hypothetical protein